MFIAPADPFADLSKSLGTLTPSFGFSDVTGAFLVSLGVLVGLLIVSLIAAVRLSRRTSASAERYSLDAHWAELVARGILTPYQATLLQADETQDAATRAELRGEA